MMLREDMMLTGRAARAIRGALTIGALALATLTLAACDAGRTEAPAEAFAAKIDAGAAAFREVCVPAVQSEGGLPGAVAIAQAAGFVKTSAPDAPKPLKANRALQGAVLADVDMVHPQTMANIFLKTFGDDPRNVSCVMDIDLDGHPAMALGGLKMSPSAQAILVSSMNAERRAAARLLAAATGGTSKSMDRLPRNYFAGERITAKDRVFDLGSYKSDSLDDWRSETALVNFDRRD